MSARHPLASGHAAGLVEYLRARRGGMPSSQAVRQQLRAHPATQKAAHSSGFLSRTAQAIARSFRRGEALPAQGNRRARAASVALPRRLEV